MTSKVCKDCLLEKDPSEYYKRKDAKDGLYSRCKPCHLALTKPNSRKYYHKNKGKVSEYNAEYYLANRVSKSVENRQRARTWYHNNRDRAISRIRAREVDAKKATPKWLTAEQKQRISAVYEHAKDCAAVSGETYHVDHIVPLKGESVCGLHVPWNLQVLPADVNIAKSNRVD